MFCAHKVLFSISIGIYKVRPKWVIGSLFIKFICLLSVFFLGCNIL